MKIYLGSDLHLEFADITLKNTGNADVLILSGDIMTAIELHDHPGIGPGMPLPENDLGRRQVLAHRYRTFLKNVSSEFPEVIYIAGNHEGYHGSYPDYIQWLRDECKNYPNIHFLENDVVELFGYTFLCGTLWTDMNKNDPNTLHLIEGMMNDFKVIRNSDNNYRRFLPKDAVAAHRKTVNFIETYLVTHPDKKYVVVGHHGPTPLSINPIYAKDVYMNGGYCSDLSNLILDHPEIILWTMGHTHFPHSYYVGDTLVVCNPRGYYPSEPVSHDFGLRYIDLDNLPAKFDGVNWSRT